MTEIVEAKSVANELKPGMFVYIMPRKFAAEHNKRYRTASLTPENAKGLAFELSSDAVLAFQTQSDMYNRNFRSEEWGRSGWLWALSDFVIIKSSETTIEHPVWQLLRVEGTTITNVLVSRNETLVKDLQKKHTEKETNKETKYVVINYPLLENVSPYGRRDDDYIRSLW